MYFLALFRRRGVIGKIFSSGLLLSLTLCAVSVGAASLTQEQQSEIIRRLEALEKKDQLRAKDKGEEIRVYFKNGFKMRTLDNNFKFQAGGRIMHDWGFFGENKTFATNFGNQQNGSRFRRVRFFMAGLLYKTIKFKWDIDVAGGAKGVTFKDMYLGMKRIPLVGNFQVGHFKRPASLDSITSSKYLTFIERSLTNTFFKTRNVGMALFNQHLNKRLTWFVFLNKAVGERPPDIRNDNDWNITSRVTALPYLSKDGKRWVHLGASWSHDKPINNTVTFNAARDTEITSTILTTGAIASKQVDIIGLEGAVNWNQFSVQSEYVLTNVDQALGPDANLHAFYVHGSWYITGENRRYKKSAGAIGRFKPIQTFNWEKDWLQGRGIGAWQVALRYAELDLNDQGIAGGKQKSTTAGLNWELNRMSRVMYNYVHADFTTGAGGDGGNLDSHIIRFQVDF
jgi:phosphate-selective porin OprO and OprP